MVKTHLKETQACYKEYVDVKRKEKPKFQVGDEVWLL